MAEIWVLPTCPAELRRQIEAMLQPDPHPDLTRLWYADLLPAIEAEIRDSNPTTVAAYRAAMARYSAKIDEIEARPRAK